MILTASKVLSTGLLLAAAGVLAPGTATAAPAPRDFGDCMDIAVGEHDADPWIAHDACDSPELTTCYRILRDAYGRQPWILDACKARTE
ncbi:hypothetical protein ADK67_31585 [Saccharothrix sp. NRRL B-16348]|uniref:hypothetical protein n=1 Tax=Saccharothrix sp. NRRL B-16348 TaxID=1415542 RepID=UPI0006AF0D95|nr:hypothetical protein [Saccharothrix sp. NRRL B-16348]KOX20085.1 hypothetical protein ADK67_31585 [Saccharothrix sp. NRRL B-16348]